MKLKLGQQGRIELIGRKRDGKYRLNPLAKLYAEQTQNKKYTPVSDFKREQLGIDPIRGRGTYANDLGVYWLAAKLDEEFEMAVFECFNAVIAGDLTEAVRIADELVEKEDTTKENQRNEKPNS